MIYFVLVLVLALVLALAFGLVLFPVFAPCSSFWWLCRRRSRGCSSPTSPVASPHDLSFAIHVACQNCPALRNPVPYHPECVVQYTINFEFLLELTPNKRLQTSFILAMIPDSISSCSRDLSSWFVVCTSTGTVVAVLVTFPSRGPSPLLVPSFFVSCSSSSLLLFFLVCSSESNDLTAP